jgi:hypothetical protein
MQKITESQLYDLLDLIDLYKEVKNNYYEYLSTIENIKKMPEYMRENISYKEINTDNIEEKANNIEDKIFEIT